MDIIEIINTIVEWYFNVLMEPWLVSIAVIALFALIITIVTTIRDDEQARQHYLLVLALAAAWPITLPLIVIDAMLGARKPRY